VYRDVNDRHADNMREEVPILGIGTEEWSSGRCGGSFWKYYRGDGRRRSHVWNASADLMAPSYDGNERHMDDTRKEVPMLGIVIESSLSGRPVLQQVKKDRGEQIFVDEDLTGDRGFSCGRGVLRRWMAIAIAVVTKYKIK